MTKLAIECVLFSSSDSDKMKRLAIVLVFLQGKKKSIEDSWWLLKSVSFLVLLQDVYPEVSLTSYHNYEELTSQLKALNNAYPDISSLYELSVSKN